MKTTKMNNTSAERLVEESKRRSVPGLHPGLNDLIRVLGKQAHCASRTLILCEPHIPSKARKTNYHKHCSPKRRSSAETIVRTSALWCPVRPDNYFYDCFNYTHYPERETDYLDIQNRYKALKRKPLSYSPPKCDEEKIRRALESSSLRHKKRTERMTDSHPRPPQKANITDFMSSDSIITSKLLADTEEISLPLQAETQAYSSQQIKKPTVNNINKGKGVRGSESVPCEELIDLRNLIRKSDRENFERMQQMLTLMKELSVKDFCRATCDQGVERYDEMSNGKWKGRGAEPPETYQKKPKPAEGKSQKSQMPDMNKRDEYECSSESERGSDYLTDSSASSVTSSGPSRKVASSNSKSSINVTESSSEESLKQPLVGNKDGVPSGSKEIFGGRESSTSIYDREENAEVSSGSVNKPDASGELTSPFSESSMGIEENRSTDSTKDHLHEPITESAGKRSDNLPSDHDSKRNPQLTVCDSPMTVHELVEVSNIITDIVVLETVNELMKKGIYTPPSRRRHSQMKSPSRISEGTSGSPFQVKGPSKSIIADRNNPKDLKSVSLPKATVESRKFTSKGPRNKTNGISNGANDQLTSQAESFTSRGGRKLGSEPGYASMKPKVADTSDVGAILSRTDEEPMISKPGVASKMGSMKSVVNEQSKVGLKNHRENEYSDTDSRKPNVSKESGIESVISKRSEEIRTKLGQSKTSMKSKPIEETSHVSPKSNQSEGGPRVGHRRSSSCRLYSNSPSPCADRPMRAEKYYLTPGASDRNETKDVIPKKERRGRLSDEGIKLSTVDSVCEREDSQNCVEYETDSTVIYYIRTSENAYPPEKETYSAAGFMLKSAYDYTIPPRGKVSVKTDLVLELPPNSYGRIAPRKCLAINFGIDVGADVIDRDCRENVTVLLFNHSDRPFSIKRGNKVAQLICESIHQAAAKEKCDLIDST